MFNSLKTSVTILLGLLLGLLVAAPLAWYGSRMGADTLQRNVWNALSAVQDRQQAMADQALKLQPLLESLGPVSNEDVFDDIQDQRSRLAGEASLTEKLGRVQRLEEALLRSERMWALAGGRSPHVRGAEPWQDYGRVWERQKRLLVREQKDLQDSVEEFDGLLVRFPVSALLAHRTFMGMINGLLGDAWGNTTFLARLSLDWVGYELRRFAALVGQQKPPDPPAWAGAPKAAVEDSYVEALSPLVFLADAPPPEDSYNELQFTREVSQNYADVELGQDKAVLENHDAPGAYTAVLPSPQKTVVYSSPN